jgi:PIF1-like helicase
MLLLHKPVRSFDEVRGSSATYLDEFRLFLNTNLVPDGIIRDILRAHKEARYNPPNPHRRGSSARETGIRADGGAAPDTTPDDSQHQRVPEDSPFFEENDGDIDIGDFEMDNDLKYPAATGYGSPGSSGFSQELIASSRRFLENTSAAFYAQQGLSTFRIARNTTGRGFGPYMDPCDCIDNEGQRIAICFYIDFLNRYSHWEETGRAQPEPKLRAYLMGVAGTGKSFILAHLRSLTSIFKAVPGTSCCIGPTGAAAGSIGGSTADRAFGFNRNDKKLRPPRSVEELQRQHRNTFLVADDEISMQGCTMFGNLVNACDYVLNSGSACAPQGEYEGDLIRFGDVPAFLLMGDFKQLPPVLDTALYTQYAPRSESGKLGFKAYREFKITLLLDKAERQTGGSDFFQRISNIRNGQLDVGDLEFWHQRSLSKILYDRPQDRHLWDLNNPDVIFATCFNRERNELNHKYISNSRDVCVVRSTAEGAHARASNDKHAGAALRIPLHAYLFVGMLVSLTVNIIPELGLSNNCRGIVVFVLYDGAGYDPNDKNRMPVVIVDFPSYTGPAWDPDHPTYVPVSPVERRCDRMCCRRFGLPLVCAKVSSIHSLQGLTVGPSKPQKRIVVYWSWTAESKWASILYVATSRSMGQGDIALASSPTLEDLQKIGTSVAWRAQAAEVSKHHTGAIQLRQALQGQSTVHGQQWGSAYDFCYRLNWFINFMGTRLLTSDCPQTTKDEAGACLEQWRRSIQTCMQSRGLVFSPISDD